MDRAVKAWSNQKLGLSICASEIRVETPPAELARIRAIAEAAIDYKGNDLWTTVHYYRQMLALSGNECIRFAVPAILGSSIVQ